MSEYNILPELDKIVYNQKLYEFNNQYINSKIVPFCKSANISTNIIDKDTAVLMKYAKTDNDSSVYDNPSFYRMVIQTEELNTRFEPYLIKDIYNESKYINTIIESDSFDFWRSVFTVMRINNVNNGNTTPMNCLLHPARKFILDTTAMSSGYGQALSLSECDFKVNYTCSQFVNENALIFYSDNAFIYTVANVRDSSGKYVIKGKLSVQRPEEVYMCCIQPQLLNIGPIDDIGGCIDKE